MNDKRVSRRNVLQTAAVAGLAPLFAAAPAEANMARPGGERGYARGPHGQVHYHDNQGASAMPLLLLHQAPMSHRQFDAVYEPLKTRGIRAIGIDMPGFGMSDPTPFVPKVADWASSVAAVLDHLRIRQADVLGHHTGALLATEVALQFPQRVRRVILNGPFPITESERAMFLADLQKTEIDFEYRADGTHLSESFVKRAKFYGPSADPRHITRIQVEKFMGFGPFWYGQRRIPIRSRQHADVAKTPDADPHQHRGHGLPDGTACTTAATGYGLCRTTGWQRRHRRSGYGSLERCRQGFCGVTLRQRARP
jgi:pimeloyl-ACP methyl ester carboxylesterase